MRRLPSITAAIIAVLIAFSGSTLASSAKEQADLLTVREAVWRDWFAGDTKSLAKLVPSNAIAISTGEEHWQNHADIFQGAVKFHASGGKLVRLEFPRTEVLIFTMHETEQLVREVLAAASTHVAPDTIIASTTSTIPVDASTDRMKGSAFCGRFNTGTITVVRSIAGGACR